MKKKTSIRYFGKTPVRALWDDGRSLYLYSAVDLIKAFVDSSNPRLYWNALKRRHPQLAGMTYQGKLTASDGKAYQSDLLDETGVSETLYLIPLKDRDSLREWVRGGSSPLDERSKQRALALYEGDLLNDFEIGTVKGLRQIHSYLFAGLYPFAGKVRDKNISKGGFLFASWDSLPNALAKIEAMGEGSFEEIVDKYVEMNVAHPFMEGNGRATRIWLDQMLKRGLSSCIDWSKIGKEEYLRAMEKSPLNLEPLKVLLKQALCEDVESREVFMKGIDYSYYYEEIGD